MKYTVKIKQYQTGNRRFVVFFDDPKFAHIIGNNPVPTPYFGNYPAAKVLEEITRMNPEYEVTLID
jgi:hypothetical protein